MKRLFPDLRPCPRCGKLFSPDPSGRNGRNACSYFCPRKPWFEGEPTKCGADMTLAERTALVRQWLGLAWKMALNYWQRLPHIHGLAEPIDLFHEGVIGLMIAARRFDPTRGAKFSTYAWHWVRQAVGHASQTLGLIRPPRVRKNQERDPLDEKWNQLLAKARAARAVAGFPEGFDVAVARGEDEGRDVIELERLAAALDDLPGRQAQVVSLRFGLGTDGDEPTLKQVGRQIGVSAERVRQLEGKAVRRLREWLRDGTEPQAVPRCREWLGRRPCRRPAALDGYCADHHPVRRLAAVQKRLERLWGEAEATGDWEAYNRHERQERVLLKQVDELGMTEEIPQPGAPAVHAGGEG
jgi:RNA polymerase sigma factor (sigma-70 family)